MALSHPMGSCFDHLKSPQSDLGSFLGADAIPRTYSRVRECSGRHCCRTALPATVRSYHGAPTGSLKASRGAIGTSSRTTVSAPQSAARKARRSNVRPGSTDRSLTETTSQPWEQPTTVIRQPHHAVLSKVQSVDQPMRLGMRCRLSPTADVPSHTSGGSYGPLPGSSAATKSGSVEIAGVRHSAHRAAPSPPSSRAYQSPP